MDADDDVQIQELADLAFESLESGDHLLALYRLTELRALQVAARGETDESVLVTDRNAVFLMAENFYLDVAKEKLESLALRSASLLGERHRLTLGIRFDLLRVTEGMTPGPRQAGRASLVEQFEVLHRDQAEFLGSTDEETLDTLAFLNQLKGSAP